MCFFSSEGNSKKKRPQKKNGEIYDYFTEQVAVEKAICEETEI